MPSKNNLRRIRIHSFYKKIIIGFGLVATIIIVFIIYFSFSNTIIYITPVNEEYSASTFVDIIDTNKADGANTGLITGIILEKSEVVSNTYTNVTSETEVPAKATGKVTIYNKYSSTQPLIASTRLLSSSGILFRTNDRVDVPPGGQVEVAVTADEPGKQGEIAPTRFTIPGLWPGLQDKIYAESHEQMTGGTSVKTVATLNNINESKNINFETAYNQILDHLETELKSINADFEIKATKKELIAEEASVEPDAVTNSFNVTTEMHVAAISYDENELKAKAMVQIRESMPEHYQMTLSEIEPFIYTIDQINTDTGAARIKITINGIKSVTISHPIFNRQHLLNKDRNDIQRYFAQYSFVSKAEVNFSPFWVFKTPSLVDHIEIRFR